ncbi:hypothetical protein CIW52_24015 [Mycolicibacterium sp. P9-64]|uniref:hypothetical protein n=1 Tax=Mycolicibacterium sp. P9-64 TaxID=2024612 RepID=UPI0011EE5DD0|nr:hypothetical protein [Mycolicibacterium sp. P9-64]KAA0080821.1 hypothetical protein CIW52_24015 [Mycolicibacterium sp. P9-64]
MTVKTPYYESRFVRANHPDRPLALWLRETLLLPTVGAPVADVWVMVFDPEGAGNRALKVGYPIGSSDYRYEAGGGAWTARIGDTTIDDESAQGAITGDGRSAAWDLRIAPGGGPPVKLLTERGYRAPFPTAKTMVRHPLATFDGPVDLDGHRVHLQHWTGSVNHNWGRRHTPAYAFGQVCGFDGAPESSLEIVTAHAAVGPISLPAATLFVLRHGGREFAVRSILGTRHTHGRYAPFAWTFGGRVGDVTLAGEITAEPTDVIGLTYFDTGGATKYCYNSALATCRIRLSGKGLSDELVASRRAMFEILLPEPHGTVPLLA